MGLHNEREPCMSVCVLDADSLRVAVGTCHKEVVGCLAWASRASHCLRVHFHSSSLLEERERGACRESLACCKTFP